MEPILLETLENILSLSKKLFSKSAKENVINFCVSRIQQFQMDSSLEKSSVEIQCKRYVAGTRLIFFLVDIYL